MARFGLEDRLIQILRLGKFSFLFKFRRLESLLVCGRRQKLGQKLADHRFGQRAGELRCDGAVSEEFHRRYALDAKRGRDGWIVIHVDLGEEKLTSVLFREFLQDRTQNATRTAPGR